MADYTVEIYEGDDFGVLLDGDGVMVGSVRLMTGRCRLCGDPWWEDELDGVCVSCDDGLRRERYRRGPGGVA